MLHVMGQAPALRSIHSDNAEVGEVGVEGKPCRFGDLLEMHNLVAVEGDNQHGSGFKELPGCRLRLQIQNSHSSLWIHFFFL